MARLSEDEILTRLVRVPLWRRAGNVITRTVEAPSFLAGIAVVDGAARAAEDMNHHPDIDIRWRDVTFTLTTHDEGGKLSAADFELAEKIDEVARENGA